MDGVAAPASSVDPHRDGNVRAGPHCYNYSYDDGRPGVELVAEEWDRGVEVEASARASREYVQKDVEEGEHRLFVCDRVYIVSYSNARYDRAHVLGQNEKPTANMTKLCAIPCPGFLKSTVLLNATADRESPIMDTIPREANAVRTSRGSHCFGLDPWELRLSV
jgi:hypothetical protein